MAVATITLESLLYGSVADSVVVSAPNDDYFDDDIILDTDPQGIYDTGFKVRTKSGAFEIGGRVVGESIPIREMTLPFHLTPESRPRFQKLWGTPKNFRKVRWIYDGPSGPRTLILRLAKEILYTTEDGADADIDDSIHAVVTALACNPMYEGTEEVQEWANPDDRFDLTIKADGGDFLLGFGGQTLGTQFVVEVAAVGGNFPLTFRGQTASGLAWNVSPAAMQTALEALSTVGAGNVTVTGTAATALSAGHYRIVFANVPAGALTGSATSLTGLGHRIDIDAGIPWNVSTTMLRASLEALSSVGVGNVTVTGTPATSSTAGTYRIVFAAGVNGVLTGDRGSLTADGFWGDIGLSHGEVAIAYAPNTGWFEVWNPTDQDLWPEWTFDPADQWQFPDFAFGQERKWNRAVGQDAARMIVSPKLVAKLSVMSDPAMDTYVSADLSNVAGLFNGVEPIYAVPPYTGTEDDPILMPVICRGPAGTEVTLRQRRFWSAESGLEA